MDELQRQGREAWLALRQDQTQERELSASPGASRDGPERSGPTLTLDQQRAQARGPAEDARGTFAGAG